MEDQNQYTEKKTDLDEAIENQSWIESIFEKSLWGARYIVVVAVIFSTLAAISLFIIGSYEVTMGVKQYVTSLSQYEHIDDLNQEIQSLEKEKESHQEDINNLPSPSQNISDHPHEADHEHPFPKHTGLLGIIIGAVDLYLIGVVLLIFGFGIYELFVSKIDIARRKTDVTILEVDNIDQLKNKIIKVIIMVLIVSFFEKILSLGDAYKEPIQMMYFAISIFALAFGVYLINRNPQKKV